MAFTLRDCDPGVLLALTPKLDSEGKEPKTGVIVWSCSDPDVIAIKPSDDGLKCEAAVARPVKLGKATVTAKDTTHPNLARKTVDFEVVPQELEDYDMTITPLPAADPASAAQSEPKADEPEKAA